MVRLLIENGCDVSKPAHAHTTFDPLDQIVGGPASLGSRVVTPLKLAKSDLIRELLKEAGARD